MTPNTVLVHLLSQRRTEREMERGRQREREREVTSFSMTRTG